eukprot:SAG11_NODE_19681_length_461_cov_1.002762_1_plen_49_part_10
MGMPTSCFLSHCPPGADNRVGLRLLTCRGPPCAAVGALLLVCSYEMEKG